MPPRPLQDRFWALQVAARTPPRSNFGRQSGPQTPPRSNVGCHLADFSSPLSRLWTDFWLTLVDFGRLCAGRLNGGPFPPPSVRIGTWSACRRLLRFSNSNFGHGGGKAEGNWIFFKLQKLETSSSTTVKVMSTYN